MEAYQELYFHLFNAVTDALAALEQKNYGMAEELLKRAQRETEEIFVEKGE